MVEFRRILCPCDFTPQSRRAFSYAMEIAALYAGWVTVLQLGFSASALPGRASSLDPGRHTFWLTETEYLLAELTFRAGLHVSDVVGVGFRVASGKSPRVVIEEASRIDADLVVLSASGATARRSWLDPLSRGVIADARLPVLSVSPRVPITASCTFGRVLCAVDFWEASMHALACAASLAERANAGLVVIHVAEHSDPPPDVPRSPEYWKGIRDAQWDRLMHVAPAGVRDRAVVRTIRARARPSREILRLADAECADVIVLGHQRPAINRWPRGSTGEQVLRHARCPVLTVP